MSRRYFILMLSVLLSLSVSCDKDDSTLGPKTSGNFEIHVSSDEISDLQSVQLEELTLIETPLLTQSDISGYNWENHLITYPESVWNRMKEQGNLLHKIFVVTVDDKRLYWGCFKDMADSGGCQNPVILLNLRHPDGRNTTPNEITIDREYPSIDSLSSYPDPRYDPRIYDALLEAGVLVDLDV